MANETALGVEEFREVLKTMEEGVMLCVLNACGSGGLARDLVDAGVVEYAVGWPTKVSDSTAITFSRSFYGALGRRSDDLRCVRYCQGRVWAARSATAHMATDCLGWPARRRWGGGLMTAVAALTTRLSGDTWRISHPFSDDLLQANALLHNDAATEAEMAECVNLWCLRRQPCQFGRVAAKQSRIHFCVLSERVVSDWSDDEIAEKIATEKRLWKQRAAFDPARGAHSFVLVVASPRVAFAAPDRHLRALSDRILELAGWGVSSRRARHLNTVTSDFLYLKDPNSGAFYGYQFNLDYFACAGDSRWWHDHRFPGGIAFTANSTGHMVAFRDWYQEKTDSREWALKQAMLTIRNAAPTRGTDSTEPPEQGRATWLRPVGPDGKALAADVACPLSKVPTVLEGKDWTRYEGVLHTDHAVREEFSWTEKSHRRPRSHTSWTLRICITRSRTISESSPGENHSQSRRFSRKSGDRKIGRIEGIGRFSRVHPMMLRSSPSNLKSVETGKSRRSLRLATTELGYCGPIDGADLYGSTAGTGTFRHACPVDASWEERQASATRINFRVI